jgi:hypothetical protein
MTLERLTVRFGVFLVSKPSSYKRKCIHEQNKEVRQSTEVRGEFRRTELKPRVQK